MIWLIGGTSSSREVSKALNANEVNHIISVASEYGAKLYEKADVRVVKMNSQEMEEFVEENKIKTIIDATHPYAVEVSKNAINLAKERKITYIRYERKFLDYKYGKKFSSYEGITSYLDSKEGNVLVTTGSNNLKCFSGDSRYYIRVLPVEVSIKKTISIGVSPKNIIGLQGPFSTEFNRAIIKNYNIKYLITKESGAEGGEMEKIDACIAEGVELLVLKRPQIDYDEIIYNTEDLMKI